LKRIVLLATIMAVTAAMLAVSSLSTAQEGDQTALQYAPELPPITDPATEEQPPATDPATEEQPPATDPATEEQPAATEPAATEQPATTGVICAPWSKEMTISQGQWVYDWYRWCVDTSAYDPALESSWFKEQGTREYGEQVNLCPESGTCTVSPGGGMKMQTTGTP
jgi:hypothetical protein